MRENATSFPNSGLCTFETALAKAYMYERYRFEKQSEIFGRRRFLRSGVPSPAKEPGFQALDGHIPQKLRTHQETR